MSIFDPPDQYAPTVPDRPFGYTIGPTDWNRVVTSLREINLAFNGQESIPELDIGGLNYPTEDGTAGQVLTTDGDGNLFFSDGGGGGFDGGTINNPLTIDVTGDPIPTQNVFVVNHSGRVTTFGFASATQWHIQSNVNLALTADAISMQGLTYPSADGTAGQVLSTDGSGNLSFQDAGGGFDGGEITNALEVNLGTNNEPFVQFQVGGITRASLGLLGGALGFDAVAAQFTGSLQCASFEAAGLSYPTSDGTNGQVLTTDGTGNLNFQNPSSFDGGTINNPLAIDVSGEPIPATNALALTHSSRTLSATFASATEWVIGSNVSLSLTSDSDLSLQGLTYPSTDGTAGQVLSTDGAGTLSFVDASGGGFDGGTINSPLIVNLASITSPFIEFQVGGTTEAQLGIGSGGGGGVLTFDATSAEFTGTLQCTIFQAEAIGIVQAGSVPLAITGDASANPMISAANLGSSSWFSETTYADGVESYIGIRDTDSVSDQHVNAVYGVQAGSGISSPPAGSPASIFLYAQATNTPGVLVGKDEDAGDLMQWGIVDGTITVRASIDNTGSLNCAGIQVGGRILGQQGADLTASSTITLGQGNLFVLSGATAINLIDTTGWADGSEVTLVAADTITINHNQTPSDPAFPVILKRNLTSQFSQGLTITLKLLTFSGARFWRQTAGDEGAAP